MWDWSLFICQQPLEPVGPLEWSSPILCFILSYSIWQRDNSLNQWVLQAKEHCLSVSGLANYTQLRSLSYNFILKKYLKKKLLVMFSKLIIEYPKYNFISVCLLLLSVVHVAETFYSVFLIFFNQFVQFSFGF